MLRSFALSFAAVTLRGELAAAAVLGFPMCDAYQVIAWLSWVPNLLLVELYVRRRSAPAARPGRAARRSA